MQRITVRNARFQQWQALLTNRTKRQRSRSFVIQGVRPISIALQHGWPIATVLIDAERRLSDWARQVTATGAEVFALAPELIAELSEKDGTSPEVVAIGTLPPDDLSRIPAGPGFLALLLDRPASPGNIGSIIRSADAFGASGVIISGHAADCYDPQAVRASTGSIFAVPSVRVPGPDPVLSWLAEHRAAGNPVQVIGTDEAGASSIDAVDLTTPTLLLVGNETTGLSTAWRDHADHTVSIPIGGSASSLNAANAATVVLYEAARQRTGGSPSIDR